MKVGDKVYLYESAVGNPYQRYWRAYTVNYADLGECEVTAEDDPRKKHTFPHSILQELFDIQSISPPVTLTTPTGTGAAPWRLVVARTGFVQGRCRSTLECGHTADSTHPDDYIRCLSC